VDTPAPWLHPQIAVRPSSVHGLGQVALAPIPAGTVVARLGGDIVDTGELEALLAAAARGERPYVDTITIGHDRHLVLPAGAPAGRANHSCDPNTWWTDALTLAARRAISAGEEVTNDYATSTDQEAFVLDCACASPLCRRRVTGDDWRRPDLRARYGEHWVPAVRARFDG
jgi:SET domain-containing protein